MSNLFLNKMIVGNTWDWNVSASDYSAADGWALKLYLVPRFTSPVQAPIVLDSAAADDGVAHRFQRTAAQSASYAAGQYGFYTNALKGAEVYTLDGTHWTGEVELFPNPASLAQGADTRSQDEIALDAIRAVLANRATIDQQEYTIGDRSLKRMSIDDLLKLEARFLTRVNQQRQKKSAIYLRWGRV